MRYRPDSADKARAAQAAAAIWPLLNPSERHGVRFGLFPSWAADRAYEQFALTPEGEPYCDFGRLFSLALMAIAERPPAVEES